MRPMIRWGGLRMRIVAWSFVPTVIILVTVAIVIFYAYQDVTEQLVVQRNGEVTRLAAGQFASELKEYADLLASEARMLAVGPGDVGAQRAALATARNRLVVFDAGVLVLDTFGTVVAGEPARPEILGQNWSDRTYYRDVLHSQTLGSAGWVVSDMVTDGPGGAEVVILAVPISSPHGEFVGAIAGMWRIGATTSSAFYGTIIRLRLAESGSAYLVDAPGRVIYHSDSARIGDDLSSQGVVRQAMDREVGAFRTQDLENRPIVASFAPVPGTAWSLITEEGWAELIRPSQGYRRSLLLLLALGVVVPAVVIAFGVGQITRPIGELAAAAQEVAQGNFGRKIGASTGDELAEMAEQFNLMSAQLEESYAHLERRVADRTKELAALNAIAATVSQSLELDEILDDALDKTLQVIEIEAGGIYLLDEQAGLLTIAAQRGFSPEFVAEIDNLKPGEGFSGRVVRSEQPIVVRDVSTDPRLTRMAVKEEGPRSLAVAPLMAKGRTLGTLFALTHGYREFSDPDVQLLTSIGHQIAVAILNARLFEQAQETAVTQERGRLARELHDAVTQTLFSANLIAETLPAVWDLDREEGQRLLLELRQLCRGASAEMRGLLMELRPQTLVEARLADLLRQLGDSVASRTGVPVRVMVEGMCYLPTAVRIALYRITQEALNNVVKHAQPNQVEVILRCIASSPNSSPRQQEESDIQVELCIRDDGLGFELDGVSSEHLGLSIMRERAHDIGASFEIQSRPGLGTQIRVSWTQKDASLDRVAPVAPDVL